MSHVMRSSDPVLFFSKKEKEKIMRAIQEAEMRCSGEIRVHLERQAPDDILTHAQREFERLGMTQTREKNGVLILLGLKRRRFAIAADRGIHEKVLSGFWDEIVQVMSAKFKEDQFAEGLVEGIGKIGEKLAEYFPTRRDNPNELPDEISYSL